MINPNRQFLYDHLSKNARENIEFNRVLERTMGARLGIKPTTDRKGPDGSDVVEIDVQDVSQNVFLSVYKKELFIYAIKHSPLFVFPQDLAEEILAADIPDFEFEDLKRLPFKRMWMEFPEALMIPGVLSNHKPPRILPTLAVQILWADREYLGKANKNGVNLIYEGEDIFSVGCWYDTKHEPDSPFLELANQMLSGTTRKFGFFKQEVCWVNVNESKFHETPDQNMQVIRAVHKFLVFLNSTNIELKLVQRKVKKKQQRDKRPQPRGSSQIYIPVFKERTVSVSTGEPGAGHKLTKQKRVRAHGKRFRYCPACKTVNAAAKILETAKCKRCGKNVGPLQNWNVKWRWYREMTQGPDLGEQLSNRYMATHSKNS